MWQDNVLWSFQHSLWREAVNHSKLLIFGSHSHWRRIHAWNMLQDCPDNSSTPKAQDHLGRQEHRPRLKDQTVGLLGHVHIFIFLWDLKINSRSREKDTDSGNEKFQISPWHLIQRPHHQRRGVKQDSESHWTLRRTLVHCKKTQNEVVWARHKSFGTFQDSPPGHCTGREKGRQTEKNDGIGRVWNWAMPWGEQRNERNGECWLPGHVVPQRSPRLWDR